MGKFVLTTLTDELLVLLQVDAEDSSDEIFIDDEGVEGALKCTFIDAVGIEGGSSAALSISWINLRGTRSFLKRCTPQAVNSSSESTIRKFNESKLTR